MRSAPRSTGASALGRPLLAWTLAALPLLAGGRAAESLGDVSRLALVWTPWLALIGWPGRGGVGRRWPLCLGLALPQLGCRTAETQSNVYNKPAAAQSGLLHYLGRMNRQVKINGKRIQLAAIEAAARDCR